MNLPPFHHQHHHHRYVSRPPNVSTNPNFFHHHHFDHRLPPPPSPLPPPPPPPYPLPTHRFPQPYPEDPPFADYIPRFPPPQQPYLPPYTELERSPRFIRDDFVSPDVFVDNQEPTWREKAIEFDRVRVDSESRRSIMDRIGSKVNPSREYGYFDDLDRFSDGAREDLQEFNRVNWKKPAQKKSVLSRIQLGKPGYRNRSFDRNSQFSKGFRGDSRDGSFRGREKDGLTQLDRQVEEENKSDEQQVELDVSFKSNSLVAKAIAVTPSGPLVGSDRNSKPKKRKVSKGDASGVSKSKLNKDSVRTSGAVDGCSPSSGKGQKQFTEKVAVSAYENGLVGGSRPCSGARETNEGDENRAKKESAKGVSEQRGTVGSIRTPLRRVAKKKLAAVSPERRKQPIKDSCEDIGVDGSLNTPSVVAMLGDDVQHSDDRTKFAVDDKVCDGDSPALSTEVIVSRVDESPQRIAAEEDDDNIHCNGPSVHNFKRKRSSSIAFSTSPRPVNSQISEAVAHLNRLDGSTISDFVVPDDTKGLTCTSESALVEECSELRSSGKDTGTSLLSSPEKTSIRKISVDRLALDDDVIISSGLEHVSSSRGEHAGNAGQQVVGSGQKPSLAFPTENNVLEGSANKLLFAESTCILGSSYFQDIVIDQGVTSTCSSDRYHSTTTSSERCFTECNMNTPALVLPISSAVGRVEGSPKANGNSTYFFRKDYFREVMRKRKSKDVSSPWTSELPAKALYPNGATNLNCKGIDLVYPGVGAIKHVDTALHKFSSSETPSMMKLSAQVSCSTGRPERTNASTSCVTVPSDIDKDATESDSRIGLPDVDSVSSGGLQSMLMPVFPINTGISRTAVESLPRKVGDGDRTIEESALPEVDNHTDNHFKPEMMCQPSQLEAEELCNSSCAFKANHETGTIGPDAGEGKVNFSTEEIDQGLDHRDGKPENYVLLKDNSDLQSNYPTLSAAEDMTSATSSDTTMTEAELEAIPSITSMEPSNLGSFLPNIKSPSSQISNGSNQEFHETPISGGDSVMLPRTTSDDSKIDVNPETATPPIVNTITVSSPFNSTGRASQALTFFSGKSGPNKNQVGSAVPRVMSGRPLPNFPISGKAVPRNPSKSRTWHRTGSPSTVPKPHSTSAHPSSHSGQVHSSYVRKGNSLVRKQSPVHVVGQGNHVSRSVFRLNSPGENHPKKIIRSEFMNPPVCSGTERSNNSPDMPILPLAGDADLLDGRAKSLAYSTCSPVADLNESVLPVSEPFELNANTSMVKPPDGANSGLSDCQTGSSKNLEYRSVLREGNSGKKMLYVKRRSNQLVAATEPGFPSLHASSSTRVSTSDDYKKSNESKLFRPSLESNVKEGASVLDNCVNSSQGAVKNTTKSLSMKESDKGLAKKHFLQKLSLWRTLCSTKSSKRSGYPLQSHKGWPYMFPWKRATYRSNFIYNLNSKLHDSSISSIRRKLLLSRSRYNIYTRSTNGFSLRRSKVLSVGGSSLKWSKSMEKHSKIANEEATIAVAAAEKRKKDQTEASLKSKNHVSRKLVCSVKLRQGERVFRIGSERYKMDPTRKTLQRISDDETSLSVRHPENKQKKYYIPSRLLIGNNEYVRIGNGNQLVRDPKKRTRTLASEKVRWSLHTARLRLAKRKKYCQFFTRFGRCNKDDGKCPYIHDPSKVAVCTKFLNSSCSNPECKLTHKVIPERMQDCSYYLQGLCSNGDCPYRHVNVNPNSPICEGFLRGYCADGNECRKKHTYVCPKFEATGNCPQGSKCKLHHPKSRKGKKNQSSENKNARGRYFGLTHANVFERVKPTYEKLAAESNDDIFCQEGKFVDYISLDVSDNEVEVEAIELKGNQSKGDEPSYIPDTDMEELIKPIRILNRKTDPGSSPAVLDSPSHVSLFE